MNIVSLLYTATLLSTFLSPVVPQQATNKVEELILVRSSTGVLVSKLTNGTVIYLNGTSPRFTVEAVSTTSLGPVKFGYQTNVNYQLERNPPFLLCGGDYSTCSKLVVGTHKVSAVVASTSGAGSVVPYVVTFEIVAGFAPSLAPVVTTAKTTNAPKVLTKAPRITITAPIVPTKAPKPPTLAPNAPIKAINAPKALTKAPRVATTAPNVATRAPMPPTLAPKVPTKATNAPKTITKAPQAATAAPIVPATLSPRLTTAPKLPVPLAPKAAIAPLAPKTAPKAPVVSPAAPKSPAQAPTVLKGPVAGQTAPKSPFITPMTPKAPAVAPTVPKLPIIAPVLNAPTATKLPIIAPPLKAPVVAPTAPKTPVITTTVPKHAPKLAPLSPPVSAPVAFPPILINCGGGTYTDTKNRVWMEDTYANGGQVFGTTSDILGTVEDELYKNMRWGELQYEIPVPPGLYEITLHMADVYFTTAGSRVFDVAVEGTMLPDLDVVQLARAGYTAVTKTTTVPVTDNQLTIRMLDNVPQINFPLISAIEVHQVRAPSIPPVTAATRTPTTLQGPVTGPSSPLAAAVKAPSAPKAPIKAPWAQNAPVKAPFAPKAPVKAPSVPKAPVKAPSVPKAPFTPNAPVKAPWAPNAAVKAPTTPKAPLKAPWTLKAPAKAPGVPLVPRSAPTLPVKAPVVTPMTSYPTVVSLPTFEPILINCGGFAYTDSLNRTWIDDKYFNGGGLFATNAAIYNHTSSSSRSQLKDYEIFHTTRWGPHQYDIPVPTTGLYEVVLHLAEIYFTTSGSRIFDALVESTVIADIDIVALSRDVSFTATSITTKVNVTDGTVTVQFFDNVPLFNHPSISAIEVNQVQPAKKGNVPIQAPAVPTVMIPISTSAPLNAPMATPIAIVPSILINCGGLAYRDARNRLWIADKFNVGGQVYATGEAILGTTDDVLFQTNRWGQHKYEIPVPTGSYEIVLHLAEIYFSKVNQRVFDLVIEGVFFMDIDMVQLSGGVSFTATSKTTVSVVTDGFVTIEVYDNNPVIDYPSIAAIEVNQITPPVVAPQTTAPVALPSTTKSPVDIPTNINAPSVAPVIFNAPAAPTTAPFAPTVQAFAPILINCGGAAFTDTQRRVWMEDKYFEGGKLFGVGDDILGVYDDELYQSHRWGQLTYNIPVPLGTYQLILHSAEIYFREIGKRVFDVDIEGSLIEDIDLVKLANGTALTAVQIVTTVVVVDGFLTIKLLDNIPLLDFPTLGAIEINQIEVSPAPVAKPSAPAPFIAPITMPVLSNVPVADPLPLPTANPTKPAMVSFEPILINCGGAAFTDRRRRLWMADRYSDGGQLFGTGDDILGVDDDELYQSHRWGQLSYKIPVPVGLYEIILHSAEIYFRDVGKRVFDVSIEGTLVEDIDLVKIANGKAFTAVQIATNASVVDGFLTIKLLDNVPLLDYPTLGAIEVNRIGEVPPASAPAPVAPTPFEAILICSGGKEYTDTQGRVWIEDKYFDGGNVFFDGGKAISGTSDDVIYQGERWGSFSYEIPMPEGDYVVILHFAEIYFEKRGERVFDVTVEGKEILDIDLVQYGGGVPTKAITREMPVSVLDGFLSLSFRKNDPQFSEPKLSGIEVRLIGVHYAHSVTGGPYIAVDKDANGYELVKVDASESHTHGPGQILKTFTWKLGKLVLGTGETATLRLPVGKHDISLTVVDSSGDMNIDVTTITVKPDGYPEIDSLSPASGGVEGGILVTLKGTAFGAVTEVQFGRTTLARSDITVVDGTTITLYAPLSALGVPVSVIVLTPFGASNSITFTYIDSSPIVFTANKLLSFANPTAVVFGPDGKLYVANTKGQLGRFTLNDNYDAVVSSVIATIEVGRGIHCIAFDPMETAELGSNINVYISTSKIFHMEPRNSFGLGINGKIQSVRGANLDIVTNVITGLPVSELDHSVNGIYFGDNGELYIGIGSNTNGGLPGALSASQTMTENYFSAAILVANLGQPAFNGFITYDKQNNGTPITGVGPNGVEVFGAGTRNPFGVLKHSNGHVYATDNGPNPGFGNMATGCGVGQQIPDAYEFDELNIIKRGNYYGHPNFKRAETDPRQCIWRPASMFSEDGYTEPMMKLSSSTNGIIEFESDHFNGQLRGDLILSKYKDGLYRVILSEDGESVNLNSVPAIALVGDDGLHVTQAPDGSMIDARYEANSCFTFQPDEPFSNKLDVKSVFPRRGGLTGGTKLMIFGVNFSDAPTVTIGGNPCADAVVNSSKKITCTLPAGNAGRADVVVTIGATSDTFSKGYRYISGRPAP